MPKAYTCLFLLCCLIHPALGQTSLVINELMASNSSVLADPQGQYDDWIEIHNPGGIPIDMAGMFLTDNLDQPTKWQIPMGRAALTTVPAHGYVLIWADQDTQDSSGLHAPFSLNADQEQLALFDIDGQTLIDAASFADQIPDISWGRHPNGHDLWQLGHPTPGAANVDPLAGRVADVQFSHTRGFYDEYFAVTLTCPTPGATIWYTTDSSEPYKQLTRTRQGKIYKQPIEIKRTTCLKVMAVKTDLMPSVIRTHSYIFPDQVLRQTSRPAGYPEQWPGFPADYGMDPRITHHPLYYDVVRDALFTHRTLSLSLDKADLFDQTRGIYVNSQREGVQWERPVSVEIIDPLGGPEIHVNAGLRIQGGASRNPNRPKHNLRLLFKGIYGATKLKFPMFEGWPVQRFDTLVLRGSNGDSWFHPSTTQQIRAQYIRDQWPRDTQVAMGRVTAGQCYIHLYLNGLYWGLYHVIERPNAAFFAEHLGGDPEDYDVLQHKNGTVDGNRNAWNAMMAIAQQGLTSPGAYQALQQYMDLPTLIDYMIVNFYMGNVDWDQNNWFGGRRREPGAAFHFLTWDCERAFLGLNDNVTGKNQGNQPTSVHQRLSANDEYRILFADHVQRHFFGDGCLTPERAQARWLARAEEIRLALVAESARWGDNKRPDNPYTPDVEWQQELDFLTQTYFPQRTNIVLNQLKSRGLYPSVAPPSISVSPGRVPAEVTVSMTAQGLPIWYTTDGSDPRQPSTVQSSITATTLVTEDTPKRILVPTEDIGRAWQEAKAFNDEVWTPITDPPGGIGYEMGSGYGDFLSVDLGDLMYGQQASCYIRIPFRVSRGSHDWQTMRLKIRYDDGFVAYLNGTEIARRNANGTPAWNASAASGHSDGEARVLEEIDVSPFLALLQPGDNLLAIHGLNTSRTSSDFLISAALTVAKGAAPAGVAPTALAYNNPVTPEHSLQLRARTLHNNTWSAIQEAVVSVGPVAQNLRITEILYHPDPGAGSEERTTEFIELTNVGDASINLNLVRFTAGLDFTFAAVNLAPNQSTVVVQDKEAFHAFYGDTVHVSGQYAGRLANNGEQIRLQDAAGQTIMDFAYDDDWYPLTDGRGYSLTLVDPEANPQDWSRKESWRVSDGLDGSPAQTPRGL